MSDLQKCEFCYENDIETNAELKIVLNEKKCLGEGISPNSCNLLDWTVYCCKKCMVFGEGETFAEYLGVPTGDNPADYFTVSSYPPKNEIVEAEDTLQKHIDRWGVINAKDNLKREIYSTLLQENNNYSKYTKAQVYKYTTDYFEYSEWIWANKINTMCPEPFAFHIKIGSFIADEMRGQVVGLYRDKNKEGWSSLKVMTKWDWRYMDEDSLQTYKSATNELYGREPDEREYYIVNTEAM